MPLANANVDWQRIEELSSPLELTAQHWAARTGGDIDDLFSVGRLAVIEQAQNSPDFLTQKDSYITTFAAWRMCDHTRPRQAEKNAVPLDPGLGHGARSQAHAPRSSLEYDLLTRQAIATVLDDLDDEAREIIKTIITSGDDLLHESSGRLNVGALARTMGIPRTTMQYRIQRLRDLLQATAIW